VFSGKFTATSGKFTAFFWSLTISGKFRTVYGFFLVILGVFGKVYDGTGKDYGPFKVLTGKLRRYREGFRFFRSYKVLSGKFSTRSGKYTGHFRCFRESLGRFTAFF